MEIDTHVPLIVSGDPIPSKGQKTEALTELFDLKANPESNKNIIDNTSENELYNLHNRLAQNFKEANK